MFDIDSLKLRTALGTARPYAVELEADLKQPLSSEVVVALYAAEQLEVFFRPNEVMAVLRWFSDHLPTLGAVLSAEHVTPCHVLTVLDYRWVVYLYGDDQAFDVLDNKAVPLADISDRIVTVSTAIDLAGIYLTRVRVQPPHQTDD